VLRPWLQRLVNGGEAFGVTDEVLAGFARVVTHPRVFHPPESIEAALAFVDSLRGARGFVAVGPGPRHGEIFATLCRSARPSGDTVWDAYHAAVAIENGCEWATVDADFARFAGLRWMNPLTRETGGRRGPSGDPRKPGP
jgi:hypothetical protein